MGEVTTLGSDLPKQMSRVRDYLMPLYEGIGPAGAFALMMMRSALHDADVAIMEGDCVKMIEAYERLRGFKE